MPRRPPKPKSEQSIPKMLEEAPRQEVATWYKDGKLTPFGRQMAKVRDCALAPEKVDEWGFLLTRKEREAVRWEAEKKKRTDAGKRATTVAIRFCNLAPTSV